MKSITTHSWEETFSFAQKIAQGLNPGDIICLYGDLGAGKTTFVKGLAKGLKIKPEEVSSPTFVLMNIYEGKLPIYHFDLYRIDANELPNIGYEEFFYGQGVSVVEWSERLESLLPEKRLDIYLEHKGESKRKISVKEIK